jgi:class 3 adenylate cyclase
VHTGEWVRVDDRLRGVAVHIGARVSPVAAPGGVLVSSSVKDLGAGSGLAFEDPGERGKGCKEILCASGPHPLKVLGGLVNLRTKRRLAFPAVDRGRQCPVKTE